MGREIVFTARAIGAIVVNTFREAVRNKIFGALLAFGIGVMLFSLVLGAMSLHNEARVATDVTLFASTFFSMIITVYVSINLLHTEIERRTIYTILSKPVRRWQFLLGKYLGILALMAVIVGLLCGVSAGLVAFQDGDVSWAFGGAFYLIFLQLAIVGAISLLFASFSTPLLSGLFAAGLFLLGHLHDQLERVEQFFELPWMGTLIDAVAWVLPDLASLNLTAELVRNLPIGATYMVSATWYAVSYASLVLFVAIVVFSRKDLE